ncbi:hypothetical protein, partial [Shewanella septentrionalis]
MDWVKQVSTRSLVTLVTLMVLLLGIFSPHTAWCGGAWDIYRVKYGHVLARGMVLDDSGFPTYVEYDDTGARVGGWAQPLSSAQGAFVMSAEQVRATMTLIEELKTEHNNKLLILSREAYNAGEFKSRFGEPIKKINLSPVYKSVVVKSTEAVKDAFDSHVLLLSRFNLNVPPVLSSSASSVLFDAEGSLIYASDNNIAFESAFFDGPDGKGNQPPIFENLRDYKAYAPFSGAEIEAWIDGATFSDKEGKFTASYNIVPCPGFSFFYDNVPIIMTYRYAGFTANGVRPLMDAQIYPGSDFCSGISEAIQPIDLVSAMTKITIMGIEAASSTPIYPTNFYVDTGFISGVAKLAPIGAKTSYVYKQPDLKPIAMDNVDFDGDHIFDKVFLGGLKEGKFVCKADAESAEYQGVFLSSRGQEALMLDCTDEEPEASQPDIIRLADNVGEFGPQGLVGEISLQDLKDTDIMVFRESTGMLITHRKGLNGNELPVNSSFYGTEADAFVFQMMIRGPVGNAFSLHGKGTGDAGFNKFQSQASMNPALHARNSDHLKPGEALRLVLINRKTGYIGTKRTHYVQGYSGGMVQFALNNIQMVPPNLKISAERRFTIKEGLSASSETQTQLIGYEGSAMGDDEMLTITTEWYDHDGSPLPEGLSDYGYTGRLAKVAGPGVLVASGGEMANFAIRPGKQLQQIRLADMANAADHFYVQVNGKPKHENPSFADSGAAESGPMAQRPKHYVPFKVPLIDEAKTRENEYLYGKLKDEGKDEGLEKPEPVYRWAYRPELQFSSYDLKVKDIIRRQSEGQTSSLFDKEVPLIGTNDSAVKLLYTLIESDQQALEFLGAGQELVFALGATELKATMGEGNQLIFENLDHIASLDVEDFVTLSLYNNTDPYNVLWEYAFESLFLLPARGADVLDISADRAFEEPNTLFAALLSAGQDKPNTLDWHIQSGTASLSKQKETNSDGIFSSNLSIAPISGNQVLVSASLDGGQSSVDFAIFKVTPGKPEHIEVKTEGKTAISNIGGVTLDITITDKHGNLVSDGTAVSVDAPKLFVSGDLATENGKVRLIVSGASDAGSHALLISAGEAMNELFIPVHNINLSFSFPTSTLINENYSGVVTATSSYGSLAGETVDLSVHRGRLDKNQIALDAAGSASFSLDTGAFSGYGSLYAKMGGSVAVHHYEVLQKENEVIVLDQMLVRNAPAASGSYEVNGAVIQYTNTTEVRVPGTVGESVTLTLGDWLSPNVAPILDYELTFLSAGMAVTDRVSERNGQASGVTISAQSTKPYSTSFNFNGQANVSSFNYPELHRPDNLGFTLIFKAESLQGNLVDYDSSGQKLAFEDESLVYTVSTDQGDYQIRAPITAGDWHEVGAHVLEQEFVLTVGKKEYKQSFQGKLLEKRSGPAFKLGVNFSGQMVDFKVYDWSIADKKLMLADGSASGEASVAADGFARFQIVAPNPQIAQAKRNDHGESRHVLLKRVADETIRMVALPIAVRVFLDAMPSAYAAGSNLPGFSECEIELPDFGEVDNKISAGEKLIAALIDCKLLQRLEQAKIRVETASGYYETTVAYLDYGAHASLYGALHGVSYSLAALLNCRDGVLTGNNSSKVGLTCDFISGLFVVGDIRDFAYQSAYYFVDEEGKYDKVTHVFSLLGILGTFITPSGAGAAADGLFSVMRVLPKAFRVNGKPTKFIEAFADHIDDKVLKDDFTDFDAIGKRLVDILPLIEVTAMVAFYHEEFAQVKEVMITSINDPQTLESWAAYIARVMATIPENLVTQEADWSLFSRAYAASLTFDSKRARKLLDG